MTDGRHPHGGLFIGILVTVIGVIFLLDQMEIVHASYIFQVFWPVILIALGVAFLLRTSEFSGGAGAAMEGQPLRSHTGHFLGTVLILIGLLWLFSNVTQFSAGRLWPLWLIAVGVWLLINRDRCDQRSSGRRQRRAWRHYRRYSNWHTPGPGPAPGSGSGPNPTSAGFADPGTAGHEYQTNAWGASPQAPPGSTGGMPGSAARPGPSASFAGPGYSAESVDDTFERSVIFMSFNRRITSRHFRFGKVSAVFGGFHLDFTGAEMEGNQAVVQIEAIFGGGEIRIPPTWRVSVTAHEIAGAIVDETYSRPDAAAPAKVLIIHGTTVFGGVVIKN